jgi:hypothetical protein
VSPATDPASTTVQVWVEAENPGEKLKPGASVHAVIITEIVQGRYGGAHRRHSSGRRKRHRRADGQRGFHRAQEAGRAGRPRRRQGADPERRRPGEEVVMVGGLGVDDKAKVKVINTTVEEESDDDTPEPPEPAKK